MMRKTPRQRRKEKNKESILDAATQQLYEKGIENISIREIAKEADYSPAALYKYFDSKEALIQAVQVRENQQLIQRLAQVDPTLSPHQRLVELCLQYIDYGFENPQFLALINSLTSARRSQSDPIPQQSPYLVFLEAVRDCVESEQVQLSGEFGYEEITYALWALIHGAATLRFSQLRDFEADFDGTNRRSIELFLKGIHS